MIKYTKLYLLLTLIMSYELLAKSNNLDGKWICKQSISEHPEILFESLYQLNIDSELEKSKTIGTILIKKIKTLIKFLKLKF